MADVHHMPDVRAVPTVPETSGGPADRECVLVELPEGNPEPARNVLAAVVSLFGAWIDVVLWSRSGATEQTGAKLQAMLAELSPGPLDINILLLDAETASALPARVSVAATGDPLADAAAITALASVAFTEWGLTGTSRTESTRAPAAQTPEQLVIESAHRDVLHERAHRDARRRSEASHPVRLMALVHRPPTWASFGPIIDAALQHPGVQVELVALDDEYPKFPGETAQFLADLGLESRNEQWALAHRDWADVVVLAEPYDHQLPEGLRVPDLLREGSRLVYSPYVVNIGGDADNLQRQHNLPLHNLAWRIFVGSAGQRALYAAHCDSGADHVRSLGSVKSEWLLEPTDLPDWAKTWTYTTTLLWNPHFSLLPGGWSTFDRHLGTMLQLFAKHRRTGFVVRPHFLLLPQLESVGGRHGELARIFRSELAKLPNVHLDEDSDYRPALHVSQATISDLSSLIIESLQLGHPVGYLRHPDYTDHAAAEDWLPEVRELNSAADIEKFTRDAENGRLKPPARRVDPQGSGQRVLEAIVGDFVQEVFDE